MAGIALRRRADVSGCLGLSIHRCISARVTRRTLGADPDVVHLGRLEGGKVAVAGVTLGGCRNMRRRLADAAIAGQRSRPIVASRAATGYRRVGCGVIEASGRPGSG